MPSSRSYAGKAIGEEVLGTAGIPTSWKSAPERFIVYGNPLTACLDPAVALLRAPDEDAAAVPTLAITRTTLVQKLQPVPLKWAGKGSGGIRG